MARTRVPVEDRFWPKVDRRGPDDCWEWSGAREVAGYGFLYLSRTAPRWAKAHRLSWEIHNGPIPDDLCILHRCDNPPCVNPAHLFVGTRGENNRDRSSKRRGRESHQFGEANPAVKLTDAQVQEAIQLVNTGLSQTSVAAQFGVHQTQVSRIVRGVSRAI